MIDFERKIVDAIRDAASEVPNHKFSPSFLQSEWGYVVDAWQLKSWDSYRGVERLGRRTRLPEAARSVLWSIFERVIGCLREGKVVTHAAMFTRLAEHYADGASRPYDFVVVDEAQDLSIAQLKFLGALAAKRPNALFFAGDTGQRIFQQPFSWRSLGVDIRGRSRNLRINYRTSHQIRAQADKLLGAEVTDADGNAERRDDTISVFNGPAPRIEEVSDRSSEEKLVADWLKARIADGFAPHELGVFVRSETEIELAKASVAAAGLSFRVLDEHVETASGHVAISTMHFAKGLEFRAVVVMACDDDVLPSRERIAAVGDQGDLTEAYDAERQLLYVACTRARDQLLVTGVEPVSEFLDDIRV